MPRECVSNATHFTVDKRKPTDASTPTDLTMPAGCVTNATAVGITAQSGPLNNNRGKSPEENP